VWIEAERDRSNSRCIRIKTIANALRLQGALRISLNRETFLLLFYYEELEDAFIILFTFYLNNYCCLLDFNIVCADSARSFPSPRNQRAISD
jgi:hypothetical protein